MAVKNTELENCGPVKGGKIFILKELKDLARVYQQESNEFDSSFIVTFIHTPGRENTAHHAEPHTEGAFGNGDQPVAVGGRLCSIKRVRCPLVFVGECDWLV